MKQILSISVHKMKIATLALAGLLAVGLSMNAFADCSGSLSRNRAPNSQALIMAQQAAALQPGTTDPAADNQYQNGPASIVGLWNISFLLDGQVVDQGFDVWHNDNTEILNDITSPIEGNVCLGVWKQTGNCTFKLYHPSFTYDANGNWTGTAIIRETVTLNKVGNKFAGRFTVDSFDTNNNSLGEIAGDISATRIRVH